MTARSLTVPVLACLLGCASTGVSASAARSAAGERPAVLVAVLPAAWATDSPPTSVDSARVARAIDRARGVRTVASARLSAALGEEDTGCGADVACARRVGERVGATHVVSVELAELGGTVLVRASVVDVGAGTRASTRQEVVRDASATRIEAALGRIGADIARAWEAPDEPAREPRWYQRGGVWAAVAGVAVAGAAAAAIVAVATGSSQGPDTIVTPP